MYSRGTFFRIRVLVSTYLQENMLHNIALAKLRKSPSVDDDFLPERVTEEKLA